MSVHRCHAPQCTREVPPWFLACGEHWFALPADLRFWVLSTYRPGQEFDRSPSRQWIDAATACSRWWARSLTAGEDAEDPGAGKAGCPGDFGDGVAVAVERVENRAVPQLELGLERDA